VISGNMMAAATWNNTIQLTYNPPSCFQTASYDVDKGTWSATRSLNETTWSGISKTVWRGNLYTFVNTLSGYTKDLSYYLEGRTPGAGVVYQKDTSTYSEKSIVSCVGPNDLLFVFWVPGSTQEICSASNDGSINWTFLPPIPNCSTGGALSVSFFSDNLFLFWTAADSSNEINYASSPDGTTWTLKGPIGQSPQSTTGDWATGALSSVVYQNNLYLFWTANNPANSLKYCFLSGTTQQWSLEEITPDTTAGAVCTTVVIDPVRRLPVLYVFFVGVYAQNIGQPIHYRTRIGAY